MSLQIAYRRWSWRDGQWWDSIVRLGELLGFQRNNRIVHTELVFSDGMSYTATTDAGLVLRPAPSPDDPLWEFETIPCSADEESTVRMHCAAQIGQQVKDGGGYDWTGALRSAVCLGREHPQDWFCSESTADALQVLGICTDHPASWYSPARLKSAGKQRRETRL